MMQNPLYIGYYTQGTPYEEEVKNLRDSLERFHLPHTIEGIPHLGSWQKNTHFKAIFIQNMLFKNPGRPLVYLDSDAVIQGYPALFDELDCDIAVHYHDNKLGGKPELLSSLIYLGPTNNTKRAVQLWRYVNQEYPDRWDQKNLATALQFMPEVNVLHLPAEYCYISDFMQIEGSPIIEQFQASRRFKKIIDAS